MAGTPLSLELKALDLRECGAAWGGRGKANERD